MPGEIRARFGFAILWKMHIAVRARDSARCSVVVRLVFVVSRPRPVESSALLSGGGKAREPARKSARRPSVRPSVYVSITVRVPPDNSKTEEKWSRSGSLKGRSKRSLPEHTLFPFTMRADAGIQKKKTNDVKIKKKKPDRSSRRCSTRGKTRQKKKTREKERQEARETGCTR